MTIRLHIERLVVDRELAGTIDSRAFSEALQAALTRSLAGASPATHGPHPPAAGPEGPLELGRHGALAERLADSLHNGIPALQAASGKGRQP